MSTEVIEKATQIIAREEGFSQFVYWDTEQYPTVGYGLKVGKKGVPVSSFDFEMPEPIARAWLQMSVNELHKKLSNSLYVFNQVNVSRQAILISMSYQMGITGLLGFRNMLNALSFKCYETASDEGLDSLWAEQTPSRAIRHMGVIKYGSISPAYTDLISDGDAN